MKFDPAKLAHGFFSRCTNDHTAPGRVVIFARSRKGSGLSTSSPSEFADVSASRSGGALVGGGQGGACLSKWIAKIPSEL
jgi:hypothetical protein